MVKISQYNPIVSFVYFMCVLLMSMFQTNPVFLVTSIICGGLYLILLKGFAYLLSNISYMLLMSLLIILINPLFNHQGMTILNYFKNGNPLTLESIIYGIAMSGLLISIVLWSLCFNQVITSDKFIYIFGRIIPSLSLILSMTLRFIPLFVRHFKEIKSAQKMLGRDISNGNIIIRIKNLAVIFSVMISWSMENAIETSDSMKSRGYGLRGRTSFSIYSFRKRDYFMLLTTMILSIFILIISLKGLIHYRYFPVTGPLPTGVYAITAYISYLVLCMMPLINYIYSFICNIKIQRTVGIDNGNI